MVELRMEALERMVAEVNGVPRATDLRASAEEKIERGLMLTRSEVAALFDVSEKKIQRMDAAGTLRRCPGLGTVVRYAARDVLRLASAPE